MTLRKNPAKIAVLQILNFYIKLLHLLRYLNEGDNSFTNECAMLNLLSLTHKFQESYVVDIAA